MHYEMVARQCDVSLGMSGTGLVAKAEYDVDLSSCLFSQKHKHRIEHNNI